MRFPGVGVKTSAAFAAAVDEVGRFRQSRTAGAYFWLIPKPSSVQGDRLDQPHHQTRRQYGAQVALRSRQLVPHAQSRQLRPQKMGHEDREAAEAEKGTRGACSPSYSRHDASRGHLRTRTGHAMVPRLTRSLRAGSSLSRILSLQGTRPSRLRLILR
ncbi:hypothetical protein R2G56_00280 [Nitratireductor aquimarinus]|uniref:Transposase IS116/IS110/IS902 family protein n=1 Tax=Nitratireductor aquimarinus TaxID=889300 RepID=A0ABU4AEN5_9HYPH|nr:hypothetical protein [Nitratireductor aquimarinus]MDV6224713.1 hypothetical protein [Nitratireductor aquimarinus]